jgi:hypothetical protein
VVDVGGAAERAFADGARTALAGEHCVVILERHPIPFLEVPFALFVGRDVDGCCYFPGSIRSIRIVSVPRPGVDFIFVRCIVPSACSLFALPELGIFCPAPSTPFALISSNFFPWIFGVHVVLQ